MLSAFKGALCRGGFVAFSVSATPERLLPARRKARRTPFSHRLTPPPSLVETRRLTAKSHRPLPLKSAPSGELLLSSVKFSVPVQVDFGQTVKVVGNHPALGSWDTGNGVELEWNDGHVWEKQVHITPGEYEFKCVVVCSEGVSKWEPGPNRVLKIEEGQTSVSVGCKWWNTGMSNINFVPPYSFESQTIIEACDEVADLVEEETENSTADAVKLEMVAAGHSIPHVEKADKEGEDAFFVSSVRDGVIGLADGVGSWTKEGIDPSMYSKGLMKEAKKAVEIQKKLFNAKESMMIAQNKNTVIGSSTCILAILQDNILDVANVGDSKLKIIRDGNIVFATKAQEHEFNCPYQLTCMDYTRGDRALNADEYQYEMQEGDIVVMGSDGVFDNLWDDALLETVEAATINLDRSEFAAMTVANAIAMAAHQNAQDVSFYSPWTDSATRAAGQTSIVDELVLEKTENPYMGGKMDDCTAVVAFITTQG